MRPATSNYHVKGVQHTLQIYNQTRKTNDYLPIPAHRGDVLISDGSGLAHWVSASSLTVQQPSAVHIESDHPRITQASTKHTSQTPLDISSHVQTLLEPLLETARPPRFLLSATDYIVTVQCEQVLGESKSINFQLPGAIPPTHRPSTTVNFPASVVFNGTRQAGVVQVDQTGTIQVFPDHDLIGDRWNQTGLKGVEGLAMTWLRG